MAESLFVNGIFSVKSFKNQLGVSALTMKKGKPKGGAVSDHLLLYNHSPYFENVDVLTRDNKKIVLELKAAFCLVITLVLISFCYFFFTQHVITCISSNVPLHCQSFIRLTTFILKIS